MQLFSWLRKRRTGQPQTRRTSARLAPRFRPQLEALEDRSMPSTLKVTNIFDSGKGSLRYEIAAANTNDVIVFSKKLDGKAITLTSGELDISKKQSRAQALAN